MDLKAKLVLKTKGATANLPTLTQARANLRWKSSVDFDLMAFGKKKDGSEFSVFTKNLGGNEGDLNSFPFIQLSGDKGVGGKVDTGGNEESITIMSVDPSVDSLDLVCINYSDASAKKNSSFSSYDASIDIQDSSGTVLVQGMLNDTAPGTAAHLCTIKMSPIGAQFINQNKVYDLQGLLNAIPGAKALLA